MMVDPCSNHPISSPLATGTSQGMTFGPRYRRCKVTSRNRSRMLATRIAATGTSVSSAPRGQPAANHGALVPAKEPLDPLKRDGIDVPGVPRDVIHLFHPAVVRRVKAVVHARGQPQGRVPAVAVVADQFVVAQKVVQGIRKPLGLHDPALHHVAEGADQPVAGAGQHFRVGVDGPRAVLELAREAIAQALEARLLRLAEIEIREQAPHPDARGADQRVLDAAQPAHEQGEAAPRDAVGQQEVQPLLLGDPVHPRARSHLNVIRFK